MAHHTGVVRMGPVAIFVLVTVVCVAIMAILSVAVSRADLTLARRQASFMEDDYANETVCQTLYAAVSDLVATGELDAAALEAARAEAAATDISGETELSAELEGGRVTARAVQPSGRTLEIVLERASHIITMEDPIEYVHRHGNCIVTQREIPTDVASYAEALRSATREAPDVMLLGEMRDYETIGTAITAAEMGQLIFSTLHTTGAAGTVDRIVDAFPPSQQRQIRLQLAQVLQAIVSQQLVPAVDGGVVPVFEIMYTNPAIRNMIHEEKTHQIDSVIAAGSGAGMRTMDQSLFELVRAGVISRDAALMYSIHQGALEMRLDSEGL